MNRRLALLGVLGMLASPAFGAHRVTPDQLQQLLAATAAQHKSDDAVAQQVYDAELVSRLDQADLARLIAASTGIKTKHALRAIADQSAFLDPPPDQIPTRPTPDIAVQRLMMTQTIHYVARTLHSLPNFLATRQTDSYDDAPHAETPGAWPVHNGLDYRASYESLITYRDGNEIIDTANGAAEQAADRKKPHKAESVPAPGLSSWGEFGPILEIVLLDAAKGKLGWSHWEQQNGKPVAVYQFSIPQATSHYTVQYRNKRFGETVDASYGGRDGVSSGHQKDSGSEFIREKAGYHGLLTIDPDTGSVLRVTLEADLPSASDLHRAAMMVEYAPVHIGDTEPLCPVHSVTLVLVRDVYNENPLAPVVNIVDLQLNDVHFEDYRRFGSEAALVMRTEDGAPSNTPSPASFSPDHSAAPQPATPAAPAAPVATAEVASAPPSSAPAPAPATPASSEPAKSEPDEEVIVRDVAELPGIGSPDEQAKAAGAAAQAGNFTLQVSTRLVDLSLIATDKHGKPIADLKADEIELYDNGRKQHLAAFHSAAPAPKASESAAPAADDGIFTNAAAATAAQDAPDLLVLMLDESHLAFNDLNRARGEVEHFLKTAQPDSRIALYAIGEHGFRVIQDVTGDHALVEAKLAAWKPAASGISQAAEEDARNRQQFDYVRDPTDLNYVNGNHNDQVDTVIAPDPQLRQMGDHPLTWALASLSGLARHFAPVAGHKSFVWISGDSALIDWRDQTLNTERTATDIDKPINHVKEALNEAHAALYIVDASVLSVGGAAVDPSLANPDVELAPTSSAASEQSRSTRAGRMTAAMEQDTRGIQDPVRQLAEGTGGRAFNKGSDLKATLDSIEQDTQAVYELGFNPDTPADNQFHTLVVKIPNRKNVKLRYRAGYLYNLEASTTKERFQQAVWSPQDLNGISLTAIAEPADGSGPDANAGAVKLRIALAGLDLLQKDGHWDDNLYIFLAQRDEATQKAEITGDTLHLALKQVTYENGMPAGIPYRHPVDVKSKLGSVRIIVVDGNSGKMGSVTIPSSALQP